MAIDDNTSYELTGAQVKDLANKIKAKAADNIFVGATSAAPGSKGLVPQPQAGDEAKVLSGAGAWVNQPTVPTVNDAALTLVQNGTIVGTFTANQNTNTTVNLAGGVYADDPASPATPTPWVTSSDIDWSTIKHSAPTTTILETIGTVSSNRSYTAPSNGFLIGKGISWANGGQAGVFLTDSNNYMVGGIPYSEYSGNNQVAFCIPVYKGQTVYFRMSGGSSRLEEVRLVASHSEASI